MKIVISLLSIFMPLFGIAQINSAYTIEGKTNKPATFTLQYILNGTPVKATAEVINGEVKLSGMIDTKTQASLLIARKETINNSGAPAATMVLLWLEPGKIQINNIDSVHAGKVYFSGTPLNDKTNELASEKSTRLKLPAGKERDEVVRKISINFIRKNPNSLVSLKELNNSLSSDIPNLAIVEPLFNGLSATIKNSPAGIAYHQRLANWKKVDIGSVAPDFKQPDRYDKSINFSAYKGKYVLLDFWASWCHPCRAENPNLLKQYELYKDKNFTILSVSLDEVKTNWIKAVNEDKLPWEQVSDLKRPNDAVLKYGVGSIPENFLIAPDGKIIAKSLRGDDLNKKLKELLDK